MDQVIVQCQNNVKTRLRHDEFWELVEVKFADPGVVMATRGNKRQRRDAMAGHDSAL